ncbi:MAG TPA: endo-1,4-beta-xylanase [Bacteroidales bacterium]|nr:endo-1,4-beta-xylanase [Bacteroidales bacterium]
MNYRLIYSWMMVFCIFSKISFGADLPVVVEAESGVAGSSFAIKTESGVTYATIKYTVGGTTPDSATRVITYTITFPDSGTYDLYGRYWIGSAGANDDSYYYGNGFGEKNLTNADDWVRANNIHNLGYTDNSQVVDGAGGAAYNVWKWINFSQYNGDEPPVSFRVELGELTKTFQIAGREDGFLIDKFVFGRKGLYFTVDKLNKGEEGSKYPPGVEPLLPPIAEGKSKFLGCAYGSDSKYQFEGYWNQVTPGNASKWGWVEGTRDVMNWKDLDEAYNFARKNKFPFKLHTLIWGSQQPTWIETLDSAEQRAEIEEWFAALAERYDSVDYIDVVNEPIHAKPDKTGAGNYIKALGGAGTTGWDWVITSFKLARQYFPKAKLLINEYSVTNEQKNANTYAQIINLLKKDNLIDGIGIQAHAFSTNVDVNTLKANLAILEATEVPIYATELDIDGPSDAKQLQDYQRIFPLFWDNEAVKGVTMWGFRPGMWRTDQKAYLIDADGIKRPALLWLRAYVNGTFAPAKTINVSSANNVTSIDVLGDTLQMYAEVLPDTATIKNVVWSVSDKTIASISATGVLTPLKNGTVTVTASCMEYQSTVKGSMDITISNQPNAIEGATLAAFSVYPNPVTDVLTLKNANNISRIVITNIAGQNILSLNKLATSNVNVSALQNGLYIIKAYSNDGSYNMVKFIKK